MPQDTSNQSTPGSREAGKGDDQQIADDTRQSGTVGHQEAAGISNRPLEEEQENQERVPPRGDRKEASHA